MTELPCHSELDHHELELFMVRYRRDVHPLQVQELQKKPKVTLVISNTRQEWLKVTLKFLPLLSAHFTARVNIIVKDPKTVPTEVWDDTLGWGSFESARKTLPVKDENGISVCVAYASSPFVHAVASRPTKMVFAMDGEDVPPVLFVQNEHDAIEGTRPFRMDTGQSANDVLLDVQFSYNGALTFGIGERGSVRIWEDERLKDELPMEQMFQYGFSIAAHGGPNSQPWLALGTGESGIPIYDMTHQATLSAPPSSHSKYLKGHHFGVETVQWHPTISQCLLSTSIDHAIKLWDIRLAEPCVRKFYSDDAVVCSSACGEKQVSIGTANAGCRTWDIGTAKTIETWRVAPQRDRATPIYCIKYLSSGTLALAYDRTLVLSDSGREPQRLEFLGKERGDVDSKIVHLNTFWTPHGTTVLCIVS